MTEAETDPVTGSRIERRYPARSLGGGVFGFAGGALQSHRLDFPRAGRRARRLARAAAGRVVIAGVAAGHPATARAGVEILADGGSAADAAVAAALASCVAETVMTGLLGGGHAIYYDAATGVARNLDFFCAVPGLGSEWHEPELVHLEVPFGAELVHYAVGPASCAVPGVPAGLGALVGRARPRCRGSGSSSRRCELARDGVAMPRGARRVPRACSSR